MIDVLPKATRLGSHGCLESTAGFFVEGSTDHVENPRFQENHLLQWLMFHIDDHLCQLAPG